MSEKILLTISDFCEAEEIEGLMSYLDCTEEEAQQIIEAYQKRWEIEYPERPKSER